MNKKILIIYILGAVIGITSCTYNNKNIEIDENTMMVLELQGFNKCTLHALSSYDCIYYEKVDCEIDQTELQAAMCNVEDYAVKIPQMERNFVIDGDYIVVDYDILYNNDVINTCRGEIVHVGSDCYDSQFERNIIGARLNEECIMEWIVPDISAVYGSYSNLVGETLEIRAFVKEIYSLNIPDFDDEFVRSEFGYDTVDEYMAFLYEELKNNKESYAHQQEIQSIYDVIIENSEFEIDEDAVVRHAAEIYKLFEDKAYILNMDMASFAQNYYGCNAEDLYGIAYEKSCKEAEQYLVVGAIIVKENISVSQMELEKKCQYYNVDLSNMDEKELCYIVYDILKEKVDDLLYDKATAT